ncbi:MAG: acylphosphatase [Candidatus Manganitrophaceae bacterium]
MVFSRILVAGTVQGVGYRNFTQRCATDLQLEGYARNLEDGRVEIEVEGERAKVDLLIQALWQGPPRAKVAAVETVWGSFSGRFHGFSVRF